ncbi:MAG: hypothetical protein HGB08_02460 [Candidatus Moranbacteria bacterium]|nr:hypothetical protein [Candidatus Moranbacteria bacterium]
MELKEYIRIIKNNSRLFLAVIVMIILAAFGYVYTRPVRYDSSLTLNITRTGTQKTDQFRYDNFYRLQADDKFTETVVEWLKSPRIAEDIYKNAGIDTSKMTIRELSKAVKPEKMSSQLVLVSFSAPDTATSKKISAAILKSVNDNANALNKDQQDAEWFQILSQDPVTVKYHMDPGILLAISFAFGIFLAFWAVMLKHYFSQD